MPSQANQPLQEGTRLENYRVMRLLAAGGFSFVYLAHDENESPVAIKEYLPSTLSLRTNGAPHPKIADADAAAFRAGLRCFFEEGRSLAHLSHPNVVRVLNFFRANETVYLVMRYERGRTLQAHIQQRRGALEERWIRDTFCELLNGLREVHSGKLLHLDIKPANVYIRNDGTPLLIDFGAARQTLGEEATKLPPTLTPGFASPEQHGRREALGPWSDIYCLGATLYACATGAPPPPADRRLRGDTLIPARRAAAGRYSVDLLDTIDACLELDPLRRPQSGLALQKALRGTITPPPAPRPFLSQLRSMIPGMR
ncbi:MAG TPA: serine/threonine-protein kinase [Burkholderiales bacterium]|jgi:serine/threonine protein kinase|nr:serine/threonine-protein kinase [Burkholderiales bacterium]